MDFEPIEQEPLSAEMLRLIEDTRQRIRDAFRVPSHSKFKARLKRPTTPEADHEQ